MSDPIVYLDLADVLALHTWSIQAFGGIHGVRDRGLVEAALAQPQMPLFGTECYPTIPLKAAALGFSIGRNHPFADGNKRTTLASMLMFLIKNNWAIEYSQSDAETLILSIACGTCSREEIATWIVERTIRGTDSSGAS